MERAPPGASSKHGAPSLGAEHGAVSCRLCLRPCLPPHPSQLTKTNDPFIWVCSKCQYLQRNTSAKLEDEPPPPVDDGHQVVPDYEDVLYCGLCNKAFDKTAQYQNHMRYHRAIRKFPCTHCSKSFSQSNNLRTHLRIHTNERPFKCLICGKAFTQVTNLNNHIRLHTGERPYVCTVPGCDKAFAQVTNLNNHRRSHQKEMPYACDLCDKMFQQQNHLIVHRQSHDQRTAGRQFDVPTCLACGECFPDEGFLKRHVRESCKEGGIPGPHIKIPGYVQEDMKKRCFFGDCEVQFGSMSKLHDHLARHHGMMVTPHPSKSKRYSTKANYNFDAYHQTTPKIENDSMMQSHVEPMEGAEDGRNANSYRSLIANTSRQKPDPDRESSDSSDNEQHHQSASSTLRRANYMHELRLVCGRCFSTFGSPESLDRHVRKKHGQVVQAAI